MHALEIIIRRNVEAAAKEAAHADADGDYVRANAIDQTALTILGDTSLLRLFNEAYERQTLAIRRAK